MKKIMFVAAMACAVMVSCESKKEVADPTGKFEIVDKTIPWDGAGISANITSEYDWSISVANPEYLSVEPASGKGNSTVTLTIAKNTKNQAIPVNGNVTFTNEDKTLDIPFSFEIPVPSLEFGGTTYGVTYMKDGKYWMTQNLRYIPEGMTVYEPSKDNADAKIWYPATISLNEAGKYVATASTEAAVIAAQGLLYAPEYILGAAYSEEEFADVDQKNAICPEGWHIPTAQEWIDLVGACSDKDRTNEKAPYYSADLSGAPLEALNADGLNFLPYPYVNNNSYLCTVQNTDTTRIACGMNSMLYFLSSTGHKAKSNVQGYGAMITNNKTKTSVNVAYVNTNTGIAVRYVKD